MDQTIKPTQGRWWFVEDDGTVWPCEVQRHFWPGHVRVEPTQGPREAATVLPYRRVYDGALVHPDQVPA